MSTKNKQRTYARNRAVSRRGNPKFFEGDSTYFLKLVIVTLIGTVWLKFQTPLSAGGFVLNALPVGLAIGVLLVRFFEKSPFDRRIWYAMMLLVTIVSYFLPAGLVI